MAQEPNWARVLEFAYERGGQIQYPPKGVEPPENHPLVVETRLEIMEIRTAIDDLRRSDLIQEIDGITYSSDSVTDNRVAVALTEKGFDVAHERELRTRQQELLENQNQSTQVLANFTVILGATAIIQAAAAVVSAPSHRLILGILYVFVLSILWFTRDKWGLNNLFG